MSVPSGYSNHRGWRSRGRNGLGILPLSLEPYRAVPSWAMRFIRDCLYGVIILLLFARPVKSEPLLGLGCPESTVSRRGSRPGPLQPRGLALEKQMFNVSFSKCFPEFRKPPETSGATGEKLLSWVKMHQCWLVSDPPDLATMWPDLVIGMGFGGGVFTSPSATPGQAWHGPPALWASCSAEVAHFSPFRLGYQQADRCCPCRWQDACPVRSLSDTLNSLCQCVCPLPRCGLLGPGCAAFSPDAKPPSGCWKDPRGGQPCGFPDTLAGCVRAERESGSLLFPRCDSQRYGS